MGKFKIGIKFDIKLLNTLTNNINSGVEILRSKHHLSLHPIHLNDFNKSIRDILSGGIAKYNKNLSGILLGYQNIKLPVDIGFINYDSCYIHIDLEADFFVFKPEIGKEMQGVVNRKSKDHVGVLVYNVFNVSIPEPQTDENWLGNTVNIGDEVLFRITYIDLFSVLPYIKGELISIISTVDVGISSLKEKHFNNKRLNKKIIFNDEAPVIKKAKKSKRKDIDESSENRHNKKIKFETNEEEEDTQHEQIAIHHIHKKKKNKFESELDEDTKKRKHKRNKEKRRKEKDGDESSLKEFNLSELFNETQITLENVKSEKGSDEDLKINNSCKRSRKLENSHTTENNLITDSQNNAGERKSKKRKEKLKERENELLPQDLYTNLSHSLSNSKESGVSAVNINRENSDSELDNLKSKKSKKRRHSCSESDIPVKKRKRKSA